MVCFDVNPLYFGRLFFEKMDQEVALSERSEFRYFPIFSKNNRGFRNTVVAFFGLPFLARQKRELAAGLPPACKTVKNRIGSLGWAPNSLCFSTAQMQSQYS